MRDSLSQAENFRLLKWIEDNRSSLKPLTAKQIAGLARKSLSLDVTESMVRRRLDGFDVEYHVRGRTSRTMKQRVSELEARLAKLEFLVNGGSAS